MPAPPMPAIQIRLPASGCELDELIRDPLRRVRLRCCTHRIRHCAEPLTVGEPRLDDAGRLLDLALGDDDCAPCLDEEARILFLVAAGGEVSGNEHRR